MPARTSKRDLTDAELAFLTTLIIEGFNLDDPSHPAYDALRSLHVIPDHSSRLQDFKYHWQEQGQIDIFNPVSGEIIVAPPTPCPWPDVESFLRRWTEILPESLARCFEKNHNPEHYRFRVQKRLEIWGEVEVNPFTAEEGELLDALSDEIRARFYGPCLRALVARNIHHFYPLELIERRQSELTEQGLLWPQFHGADPLCPWLDQRSFDERFGRELHPNLYYPMQQSWKAGLSASQPRPPTGMPPQPE
jgi:hypothetical protein